MTTKTVHPSNRLYHGECTDVVDALETYIRALRHEQRIDARLSREWPEVHLEMPMPPFDWNEPVAAAEKCLKEHRERVKGIETALFEEWAKSTDENVRMIGEAALAGDYSSLAI
jgi:hypothetical protein